MPKNCIITLDPATVEKARSNANKLGKSLKEVIEDAIITTASSETEGPWITEKEIEALPWGTSRVTLSQMRDDGRLLPGKHYKRGGRNNRFLYYNKAELQKALSPEAISRTVSVTPLGPVS